MEIKTMETFSFDPAIFQSILNNYADKAAWESRKLGVYTPIISEDTIQVGQGTLLELTLYLDIEGFKSNKFVYFMYDPDKQILAVDEILGTEIFKEEPQYISQIQFTNTDPVEFVWAVFTAKLLAEIDRRIKTPVMKIPGNEGMLNIDLTAVS